MNITHTQTHTHTHTHTHTYTHTPHTPNTTHTPHKHTPHTYYTHTDQSTTGSRGVRISGSNAGYNIFRGSVKWYWLPTPFASFTFISSPVRHRVPSHFNWSLQTTNLLWKLSELVSMSFNLYLM